MKATRDLPPHYQPAGTFDLSKNRLAVVLMNIGAVGLLFVFGALFLVILVRLRPQDAPTSLNLSVTGAVSMLGALAYLLAMYAAVIVLHEAVHGAFFWLFTRSRPRFALKTWYAYAAAPGWYLPCRQYAVVGAAPLVLLSLLGILLFLVAPASLLMPIYLFITINASGAVGDLAVLAWLFSKPAACLASDQGDAVTLFTPQPDTGT